MAKFEKLNKDEAYYGWPPPLGEKKRCELCRYFSPAPDTYDGAGTCDKVNGIIKPTYGCMDFKAQGIDLSKLFNNGGKT